jgi:ketosteroid isomerase-like protein
VQSDRWEEQRMAHPNEDLVRRGFAAFGTGDMATLGELFADDIVWHAGGRSPISGDYKGKDEVFGLFARFAERTGGTLRVDIHDVLANDEHVVALTKSTAEREGKSLSADGVQVFHVKDGKVTESWFHAADQYASDEFWS